MKRIKLMILLGGLLLCSDSSFAQTADFTFAYTNGGCAPDSVLFTNTSTGAHAYRWNFGDFSPPDTNANPYHTYFFDGTFVVELTAYDTLSGDSSISIQLVLINFMPFPGWAFFMADPNPVCPNAETQFLNFLSPAPDYSIWDFDDGDSSSVAQPTHTFAAAGDYMVTFIAGNSCGTDTFVDRVTVDTNATIIASWSVNPNPACPNQSMAFTNNTFPGTISQIWNFGDGDSSTTYDAFHTYPDTGTYMVTLIAFSSCNSDTFTAPIVIDSSLIPIVNIFASTTRVCPGDDVDFQAFGSNLQSYLWDFGDSSVSLQQNPTHAFADTGKYTVIFVGTNYCGNSDTDTIIVTVGDSLPPSFVGWSTNPFSFCSTFSNICPGSDVQFNNTTQPGPDWYWDFGDGDTSNLFEPTHSYADTGAYTVTLIATSSCNGVDSVTNCVYVANDANPFAQFCFNPICSPPEPICPGTAVFFTNWSSDTSNCLWSFGDGDSSTLAEPVHVFTDTGTFTILLKITNGCGNNAYWAETITVTYDAAPPNHTIEVWPGITCPGEDVNFNLTVPPFMQVDTADVLWDFGDGSTSNTTNPIYAYDTSGTFIVEVIVFTACGNDTATTAVTIKPGSSPDFTYSSVCLGDSVQFTDASTGSPESYAWDFGDGDTSTVQNPLHEFDSAGLSYNVTLTVVDSGCLSSITKSVTVGETSVLMSSTNANCGQADGQASAAPAGGSPPYTYLWNDTSAQTTATATGLLAGTYQVVVEDSIGCLDTGNVVIGDIAGGIALIAGSNNATCFSVCDGDATATISGGTSPYTFAWNDSGAQTTITATGLCAATFDVIVTDAVGCKDTASVVITEPSTIVLIMASVDATCATSNGEALVSASGGTGAYTYLWDDPGTQTTDTASALGAGTYNVTVTDAAGCTETGATIVNNTGAATVSIDSIVHVACNGDSTGEATVSAVGGSPPYTYSWDDPAAQTTAVATGLPSGTYVATVTDNVGCIGSDVTTVNEPTALSVALTASDPSCFAACNGSATANVSGGVTPYSYVWSDSQTSSVAIAICDGSYTVVVTDSASCVDSVSVVLSDPSLLTISVSGSNNVSCNGDCDGDATAVAAGGTGPYTYLWDDPGAQTTSTATGLCADTVIVLVEDSNACIATDSIEITQPALLLVGIASTTDVTCNSSCDGTATGAVSGGSGPYTYLWDDAGMQTTIAATGLCAASYKLLVTDSNGCADSATAVIAQPSALVASIVGSNNITCNALCDGDATGAASGGTLPYTYLWDDPGTQTNLSATNLCVGSFKFEVTDGNTCIDSATIVVTEPSAVVATITDSSDASCNGECNGTSTVSASGGDGPYGYAWDDLLSQATAIADSLCAGPYSVVVTDTSGCTDTASVVITEPSVITLAMGSTDATCGVANGTASVSASGGAGSYAYLWDDPGAQTTDTATALNAGGYTVAVTDTSGCSEVGVVSVNNTGAAIVSITDITNVTCNGANDGSAVVLATGGTLPYTYSWDDPGTQSTDTATGLAGGTYVATVTDSVGCIASDIAVVLEPAALSLSTGTSDASCAGVCDGTATVTASGGTGAYTYLWDDPKGQTTATADSLCAGGYNVMITDSNGCQNSDSATVVEPATLTVTTTTSSPSCPGVCDGTSTAVVGGGTPTYTYLWTDSIGDTLALGGSIGGLCAGNYGLTVTDGNGCEGAAAFTHSDPANMVLSFTSATASCGAANGSASVTVTNGTPPYAYLWDDPGAQTTDTASALAAGTYGVTVTDSNGCTSSTNTTIGNTGAPNVSISVSSTSCNGICNGTATATATGGSAPYTYLWDDPAATTVLTAVGLCADPYTIMVTDSLGCVAFASDTIFEPSVLTLISSSTDATCNGDCDGTAAVTASGGTLPYGYLWDDPSTQTNASATSLCAGAYMLVVTDTSGCSDTANVVITDPAPISLSTVGADVSGCGLCDGSVTATASGGTGSLAYLWDDPGTQTGAAASSLCSGIYSVLVTDSNGCTASAVDTVDSPGGLLAGISGSSDISCNGVCDGTATAAATGGTTPFTYLWDDPGALTNATAVGLCAGTFSCDVTDSAGCTSSASVTLTEPGTPVTASVVSSGTSCPGICDGTATINAAGGTPPYTYLWDDPGMQTDSTATDLCGGAVSVLVTDTNGCSVTITDSITEGAGLTTNFTATNATSGLSDGTATVAASGGTLPYTYLWDDAAAQTTSTATGLPAGTYTCTITDSIGCTSSGSATVGTEIGLQEFEANLFVELYPNPVRGKATLLVVSVVASDLNVQVQNLLGETLLEMQYTDRSSVNDEINLEKLPNGIYLIRVVAESGSITRRIAVAR